MYFTQLSSFYKFYCLLIIVQEAAEWRRNCLEILGVKHISVTIFAKFRAIELPVEANILVSVNPVLFVELFVTQIRNPTNYSDT